MGCLFEFNERVDDVKGRGRYCDIDGSLYGFRIFGVEGHHAVITGY